MYRCCGISSKAHQRISTEKIGKNYNHTLAASEEKLLVKGFLLELNKPKNNIYL